MSPCKGAYVGWTDKGKRRVTCPDGRPLPDLYEAHHRCRDGIDWGQHSHGAVELAIRILIHHNLEFVNRGCASRAVRAWASLSSRMAAPLFAALLIESLPTNWSMDVAVIGEFLEALQAGADGANVRWKTWAKTVRRRGLIEELKGGVG